MFLSRDFEFVSDLIPSSTKFRKKPGRKSLPFDQKKKTVKWITVKKLLENDECSSNILLEAALIMSQKEGKFKQSKAIKVILNKSKKKCDEHVLLKSTPSETFEFFLKHSLTQRQYQGIRLFCKSHRADIFSTYNHVLSIKKLCYPIGIIACDWEAKVPLQTLLTNTIDRFYLYLKDEIKNVDPEDDDEWIFELSYGFDGSSGYSHHQMKMAEEQSTDEHIFSVVVTPLRIRSTNKRTNLA